MTTTKSRAQRAADQAAQDQQREPQPEQEQQQPAPGPSDPPDANGGPSSDTRAQEDQGEPGPAEDEDDQEDGDEPEPEAAAKPEINVEAVPVTYYRPTVRWLDGKTVQCQHKYLHEGEKAAAQCGRRIAAAGAFVK